MPIPSPHKGESRSTFISRCAGDKVMNKDYTDQKQKLAVCFSAWKRRKAQAAYVITAGEDEYVVDASQSRPNRLYVPENWDKVLDLSTKDFSCYAGANDWENSWTAVAFVFGSGTLGSYTRRVWGHIQHPPSADGEKWTDAGKQVVKAWHQAATAARDARARDDYKPGYGVEDFTDTAAQVQGLTGWGVERVQWIAASKQDKTSDIVPSPYGLAVNPDNSNAPSHDLPMPGSDNRKKKPTQNPNTYNQGKKPDINDMEWMLGGLDYERDPQTGLAKWPLSFRRLSKDTKIGPKSSTKPGNTKPEQPPTAA